jgi:hypothetical protein
MSEADKNYVGTCFRRMGSENIFGSTGMVVR